jgi:hypothetical protein
VSDHTADGPGLSRRLLLGVSLGVAVAAAGGLLLFVTGGDPEPVSAVLAAPAATATDADEAAAADDELSLEALPTVTYDVFLDRDPFEPVLEDEGASSNDGGDTADTEAEPEAPAIGAGLPAGSIIIDPTTGQAVVVQASTDFAAAPSGDAAADPDNPSAPSNPAGCQGEDEVVCDGRVLTLADISTKDGQTVVVIQVDDVLYEVAHGEVFATSFRLLSVDGTCVTLQYGDDTVRLCEGRSVMK